MNRPKYEATSTRPGRKGALGPYPRQKLPDMSLIAPQTQEDDTRAIQRQENEGGIGDVPAIEAPSANETEKTSSA